jgi:PleD family two-component response regulator
MTQQRVAILLVEDSPSDARRLHRALTRARGIEFTPVQVEQLKEALEQLAHERFEVILLDLSLPDSQGLETLRRVQAHAAAVPIVVLTGLEDEELALQALHEGAQDYLVKGQVDSSGLVRALRYAMERKRGEQALREHEQRTLPANLILLAKCLQPPSPDAQASGLNYKAW